MGLFSGRKSSFKMLPINLPMSQQFNSRYFMGVWRTVKKQIGLLPSKFIDWKFIEHDLELGTRNNAEEESTSKCALSCRNTLEENHEPKKTCTLYMFTMRKKSIPCHALHFSEPNKFVIAVYITDMIFTLYRCDDWQIDFHLIRCDSIFLRSHSLSLSFSFRLSSLYRFVALDSMSRK